MAQLRHYAGFIIFELIAGGLVGGANIWMLFLNRFRATRKQIPPYHLQVEGRPIHAAILEILCSADSSD